MELFKPNKFGEIIELFGGDIGLILQPRTSLQGVSFKWYKQLQSVQKWNWQPILEQRPLFSEGTILLGPVHLGQGFNSSPGPSFGAS